MEGTERCIMINYLNTIDTQLFLFLNGMNSPFLDEVMYFVSGKLSWLPFYVFIVWMYIKKYKKQSWLIMVFTFLLILCSDQSSVHLFKEVFQRLRPCHNPAISQMVHLVHNRCGGQYGFVSSHAANTFALAVFLWLLFKNRTLTLFSFFWASWVSYSRVYLGRHFPGDVLAGALLGIFIGLCTYQLLKWTAAKLKMQPI